MHDPDRRFPAGVSAQGKGCGRRVEGHGGVVLQQRSEGKRRLGQPDQGHEVATTGGIGRIDRLDPGLIEHVVEHQGRREVQAEPRPRRAHDRWRPMSR